LEPVFQFFSSKFTLRKVRKTRPELLVQGQNWKIGGGGEKIPHVISQVYALQDVNVSMDESTIDGLGSGLMLWALTINLGNIRI
jgi:hypothetical protein